SVDTVAGLDDDNVVGPFPIGFDFPYYWYDVNEFYVGSNGYISFSDDALEAHPFDPYPNPMRPNDVLAPLADDLLFGPDAWDSTACRYAVNPAADTCVIEYRNVPFWQVPPFGNNTFQIILSKPDSTIRYQYYQQDPAVGSGSRAVGWEDQVGNWGYTYFPGVGNEIHAGLAIAIYDTATVEPPFDDVAVQAVMSANSGGFFTIAGEVLDIWADIANTGNQIESTFDVRMTVRDIGGMPVLQNTQTIVLLNPGEVTTVTFTPWTPTIDGQYTITVENLLSGDMNPNNDEIAVECHVVTLPAIFDYTDGTFEDQKVWAGPEGGFANYFVPPRDSVRIARYEVNISSGTACQDCYRLYVLDDNGPGGLPGDTLAGDTLDYGGIPGWQGADIFPKVEITDGSGFYVVWIHVPAANPWMGTDLTAPLSFQTWEYTGAFAPSRWRYVEDCGIRCVVEPWSVPDVIVSIDEFQRTTVRGAQGVTPPNASLDFAVNFRNTTPGNVATQWWIDAYLGPNLVLTRGPYSLFLLGGQDVNRIYGLPVPSNAPVAANYMVFVRVGTHPDVSHQDSFPVQILARGEQ
ncbi:hypothetical protein AMJ39_08860, partial [candidate division TA06 bacterium DG_24]